MLIIARTYRCSAIIYSRGVASLIRNCLWLIISSISVLVDVGGCGCGVSGTIDDLNVSVVVGEVVAVVISVCLGDTCCGLDIIITDSIVVITIIVI